MADNPIQPRPSDHPVGPLGDLCRTMEDLLRQHGLVAHTTYDPHASVIAHWTELWENQWIGIIIDGNSVLYDVYAQDEHYSDRWVDSDGHLFVEVCDIHDFDPEKVIPELVALLPR